MTFHSSTSTGKIETTGSIFSQETVGLLASTATLEKSISMFLNEKTPCGNPQSVKMLFYTLLLPV